MDQSEQGSVGRSTEPSFLAIGQILKPHGVRGEMRVRPLTDLPERFTWLETVYVGEQAQRPYQVAGVRFHQDIVLLQLHDVPTREAAALLRGQVLLVPIDEAIPLAEDEYFLFELEGLAVYTDEDEHLGEITAVLETGANTVLVVDGDQGELLLPNIPDVVLDIDFENGRMRVHLLPGLLS